MDDYAAFRTITRYGLSLKIKFGCCNMQVFVLRKLVGPDTIIVGI
jgi:hypothetical protein